MTYKTVVSVAETEQEMVPRIRAHNLLPQLIDETARLLVRANRAARIAYNRGMPPEQVLVEVLRRTQIISAGLPADWCRWVDGELYRARQECQMHDAQVTAVIDQYLKRLMVRPVGVDEDAPEPVETNYDAETAERTA